MPANRQFNANTIKRKLKEFTPHNVESECVAATGWVPTSEFEGELTIAFQHRGTYKYYNFPVDEWLLFNNASSRGTYFNLYIRDHGYSYERIG